MTETGAPAADGWPVWPGSTGARGKIIMKIDKTIQDEKKIKKKQLMRFIIEWAGISVFLFIAGIFHDYIGWHKSNPSLPSVNFHDAAANNMESIAFLIILIGIGAFCHVYIYKPKNKKQQLD